MKPRLSLLLLVFWGALVVWVQSDASASTSTSSSSGVSIPRSTHRLATTDTRYPPWNLSPKIDENGFLFKRYGRVPGEWEKEVKMKKRHQEDVHIPCTVRQVPGDGNCLFHSISTCYYHAMNGTHLDLRRTENLQWLYQNSARLRQQAVDCLEQRRKLLFLQGHEYLKAQDLVEAAASQYGISGGEYCHLMRQDSYWGGGPEIVALCNVLQRPIHVYELFVKDSRFVMRRMACFGSPKFDRFPALHILSADSRFPDLSPGKQLASGNHFLAMFPAPKEKKQRLRGGDSLSDSSSGSSSGSSMDDEEEDHVDMEVTSFRPRWWRRLIHSLRTSTTSS